MTCYLFSLLVFHLILTLPPWASSCLIFSFFICCALYMLGLFLFMLAMLFPASVLFPLWFQICTVALLLVSRMSGLLLHICTPGFSSTASEVLSQRPLQISDLRLCCSSLSCSFSSQPLSPSEVSGLFTFNLSLFLTCLFFVFPNKM